MFASDSQQLPNELALRQRLRSRHERFLTELTLELLRTQPFMMNDWTDFLRWQVWVAILFLFAFIVSVFALLGGTVQRRTTVMLPPVYETRFQTVVIGILFAPIGALVNIDVLLKPVMNSTLMPFDASVYNSVYVCFRAVLLFTQVYLSQICHRNTVFYWSNPVVSLAIQNIILAAIYQWCVNDDRVRAVFAGQYDAGSTSHCHVVIEQELAENLGGGLQVQKQATGTRSAGAKSPSERTGASPAPTVRRRGLRNPFNNKTASRGSVLPSSPSHFDLDGLEASGQQLQQELEEMIARDRLDSPSLSPLRRPKTTSPPIRRMQTIGGLGLQSYGSPPARPTFRHTNTLGRLEGGDERDFQSERVRFDRDMGPQPAIIHEVSEPRITADRGRDFGPMVAPTSPPRPSTRAHAARSLPNSPLRRPAASPPFRPTYSPPRRPASPPFRLGSPSNHSAHASSPRKSSRSSFQNIEPILEHPVPRDVLTSPRPAPASSPQLPMPARSSMSPLRSCASPPKSVSISPDAFHSPTRREERDRDSPFARRQSRHSIGGLPYQVGESLTGFDKKNSKQKLKNRKRKILQKHFDDRRSRLHFYRIIIPGSVLIYIQV